jgi:hypothetical protein
MKHGNRSSAQHDGRDVLLVLAVVAGRTDDVKTLFDEPPPLRVSHGLEAVVCAELPIDVMEVVPERLSGDTQSSCNSRGVTPLGKELENATLLLG